MQFFFAVTLFLSSALLFLIQPMFAKMVLPRLGGTPAVWNTCMVFFQAVLLAGYAYAHAVPAKLGVRRHAVLHLLVLLLPFVVLPITLSRAGAPPAEANPIPWLFGMLAITVGLPFFVVSTSGPLLQRWFARTGDATAADPYFLYSAGNLGSMLALLSYPILLEPLTTLKMQNWLWTGLYSVLFVMIAGCAFILMRSKEPAAPAPGVPAASHLLRPLQRAKWVLLAFAPSSLLLSVTTYLTTDLAAIPLLWVIPLAIYLLSFILVFARKPPLSQGVLVRVFPFAVLALAFAMLSQATQPVWFLLALHLGTFFVLCMVCHGELAQQRPRAEYLTEFYLWLSVGGVLGGLFNALVAPMIFNAVVEYPLVLALACALPAAVPEDLEAPAPRSQWKSANRSQKLERDRRKVAGPATADEAPLPILLVVAFETSLVLLPGALAVGLTLWFRHIHVDKGTLEDKAAGMALIFGLPVLICYTLIYFRVRFGLAIGFLLLAGMSYRGVYGKVLYRERSFFGIHRVTLTQDGDYYNLVNGSTVHGIERVERSRRAEPFTYYHPSGPIGQVFAALSGKDVKKEVALVGLGAGSLAFYGEPGEHFTYYEIDPAVVRIARDSGYFTFLRDCKAKLNYVLGDARLTLHEAPDNQYGILVMDAFSSDAIPLHLLTREALELYLRKLKHNGILAFHISNNYLELAPALAALAKDAGLQCWSQFHVPREEGPVWPAHWVVMAHQQKDLGGLLDDHLWAELKTTPGASVWTDDFSNIVSVLRWR